MDKKEKSQVLKLILKKMSWQTKVIIILTLALIIAISILFGIGNNKKATIRAISSLKEVLEINELSTVDYIYNAIATKYDDNNNPMYYVSYKGTVRAGINFEHVITEVDEDNKTIIIKLPEIEYHDISVDMGSLEYIFTKSKYETETISGEALAICEKDLEQRLNEETLIKDTAKENAELSLTALITPWIESLDSEYIIAFK